MLIWVVSTANVTSILFLFSLLVLFTYIVPYFTLWSTFKSLGLIDEKYVKGFYLLVFLSYVGFLLGDKLAAAATVKDIRPYRKETDYKKFELYSIITGIIGLLGYGYFILASGASYYMGHQSGDFTVGG